MEAHPTQSQLVEEIYGLWPAWNRLTCALWPKKAQKPSKRRALHLLLSTALHSTALKTNYTAEASFHLTLTTATGLLAPCAADCSKQSSASSPQRLVTETSL